MERKKHLIFCNSFSKGGGERIAVNLANGFYKSNEDVILFSIENNQTYKSEDGIKTIRNPFATNMPVIGKLINNFSALLYLIYIVKKHNIDVVISHLFRANYINIVASFFSKHTSMVVTHGSILKYLNGKISSKINLILIKKLYPYATIKVFLTERMKEDYIDYVGNYDNYVIANCYDLNEIKNLSKVRINDCPFEPKEYFIFVGRFHSVKRINDILTAFSNNNLNVLLLGNGDLLEEFKNKFGSNKRICFLGEKKNPFPYIKNAKATLLASESEGFPNVLIESLNLGVPIISSDCRTGPREILKINAKLSRNKGDYIINDIGAIFNVGDTLGLENILINFNTFTFNFDCMESKVIEYDIKQISKSYLGLSK
ncbi:glycosyltransferase [Vibrio sp. ZSDE26]|uniref:Glycosyltransferase n=1 Tax=Vibrio amylolyticus TaxID=2847292 RepID=A0A9X1XLS1_9VIBR|nr:glycosyltransferase [Vibrio amylolyticus]MCK6263215.1 glycosyltransferase [Vibrio amylolyticus]